jgi:hypothetical protein
VKSVQLDYLRPARRARWPGFVMLAAALAIAGELGVRYRDVKLELARLEAQSGLVSPERRAPRAIPKERLDEEAKGAEVVVRQLTLPWATLIRTIEQAATRDVALLQLQPDAETRTLRITAEARHREAMFEYLRRLAAGKGVAEVHVVSHQVQRDDPRRPIQFSVHASLRAMQ